MFQDRDDEERTLDFINKMVDRARADGQNITEAQYTELLREDEQDRGLLLLRAWGRERTR